MADFWVRKNGGASKAAAVDLTNAMSVATFNAGTFDVGDRVYFSGIDGDLNTAIVPPVGGVTLLADPERGCLVHGNDTIESCIDIVSRDDVEVDGIDTTHPTTDGVQVRGTSSGVIIRNVESSYSGNQAFQMEGTASATFYDIIGKNCVDDGFSMHNDAVAVIYGGVFTDNEQGINSIAGADVEAYNCHVSGCSAESIYVADVADSGKTPSGKFVNCEIIGGTRGVWGRYNANIQVINCIFDAMAMPNHCVDLEATTTGFVFGSVFYGIAALKFGVSVRAGCMFNGLYNSIFLPGAGRGFFAEADAEVSNSIFTGLNLGIYRSAGTVLSKNCCFYGNTTDRTGTITHTGTITADPILSGYILGAKSPCISTGLKIPGVTDTIADRYGTIRALNPSVGQDQTTALGYGPWSTLTAPLPLSAQPCKGHALPIAAKKVTVFPGVASASQIREAGE